MKRYDEAFNKIPEIIVQKEIPQSDTCRHLYIIRLDLDKLKCTRREFFDAMSAENVQCQIHYVPVYWFPFYKHMGYEKGLCPKAEEVYKGIMSIPLYPKMTDQDVTDVISGRLLNTLLLGGIGYILTFALALLVAVICAFREGSLLDRIIIKVGTITSCIPEFWLSLVLILIFGVTLHLLPSSGAYAVGQESSIASRLEHMILPLIVLVQL